MLNVGGSILRQGPLVRGLTIAFNMSGQQTTFVWRLVLLIGRSRGGLEGWVGGCWSKVRGEGGGVKLKLASSPVLSWGPRKHHVPHRCLGNRP